MLKYFVMELKIFGSGTCDQSPERACAGYLLRTKGKTFLLDAGPGVYGRMSKYKIPFSDIDEIFISHFHLDHVNDLPAILFSLKHCSNGNDKKAPIIHGPAGFKKSLLGLLNAYGNQIISEEYRLDIIEHWELPIEKMEEDGFTQKEGPYITGSVIVRTLPMEHSNSAIGYRFEYELNPPETDKTEKADKKNLSEDFEPDEDDAEKEVPVKSFTYSGDTEPCNNIILLAKNTDCLLMEATCSDENPKKGHTTTSQAAAVAKKAEAKSLMLTHISPENGETDMEAVASQFYDGIVIAVRDGMRLSI